MWLAAEDRQAVELAWCKQAAMHDLWPTACIAPWCHWPSEILEGHKATRSRPDSGAPVREDSGDLVQMVNQKIVQKYPPCRAQAVPAPGGRALTRADTRRHCDSYSALRESAHASVL